MSTPSSAPSPPEPPSLTFGGYVGQPGQLEGVGFWPRALARLIDLAAHYLAITVAGIGFGIMIAIAAILTHSSTEAALAKLQGERFLPFLAGLVGATVFEIVCEAGHGSTLGKLILGMTVVQEDRSFCRLSSAVKRSLAYYLDSLFFGLIGYLEMKGNVSEQRHGDKWAKTVVCKRSNLQPEQLRSGSRFAAVLFLAMAADGAAFLGALTLTLLM
jgi:uncharacterized RDD family membrane protein YckC